jgi:hypothetical protein
MSNKIVHLSARIHEAKGKAWCGDNARPSIYILVYIYIYIYDLVCAIKPIVGFT